MNVGPHAGGCLIWAYLILAVLAVTAIVCLSGAAS